MGKPKAREEIVRVRFTAAELAKARARAKAEGVPLSTFLRRLALTTRALALGEEDRVQKALAALGALSHEEAEELRADVRELREGWDRRGGR
jgi:hypothetical protein